MSSQDFAEMDPENGQPRNRRGLRPERRNFQAIAIAAVPIVVLLAVVIAGILLVNNRNRATTAAPTPTVLPTQKPTALVPAVAAAQATATSAAVEPTATTAAAATAEPTAVTSPEATTAPTATPEPTTLGPGAKALVTATVGLNVRADASLNAVPVKVLQEGAVVDVVGGPKEADNYTWYEITDSTGARGWAVSDWLELAP